MNNYWYYVLEFTAAGCEPFRRGGVIYAQDEFFPVARVLKCVEKKDNFTSVVATFWAEITKDTHDEFLRNEQKIWSFES